MFRPQYSTLSGFPVSDNIRRYCAVGQRLRNSHPEATDSKWLCGHLRTLAGMVAGIVASSRTRLQKLGMKAPDSTKPQTRTKRFERFLQNERTTFHRLYEPFARSLFEDLSSEGRPLLIVFESSSVGRGGRLRQKCPQARLRRSSTSLGAPAHDRIREFPRFDVGS
jgi:hypothetical protein